MLVLSAVLAVAGLALAPALAQAGWTSSGAGSGTAKAQVMPTGQTPTVSVSNRDVTVSWGASTLPGGVPVGGYVVKRYDAGTDALQTIGASCTGTVSGLTCTETIVPPGSWRYTVTPVKQGWVGGESAKSSTATVSSPTLGFTSPTTISSLPATLNGNVANFAGGETLTFRLDNATSGTLLSGSSVPSPVPGNGSASITVTIPVGVTNGTHTVYAVGSAGSTAAANVLVDMQAPTVSGSVIAKSQGGTAGFVKQGGTYRVYANVSDGAAGSGVATVTANVNTVTTGQTAAALTSGSYTVGGTTYNYRSAQLTASNPLAAGAKAYTITAADSAGNGGTQGGFTVTVDNTAPTGTNIQTTNVAGGTTGQAETGDIITYTFSETMDPESILAGWTGGGTAVTLRLIDGGAGNDTVQIWNAANTAQLPLGSVNLARTTHVTATVTFTNSTMTQSGAEHRDHARDPVRGHDQGHGRPDGLDAVRDGDRPRRQRVLHHGGQRVGRERPKLLAESLVPPRAIRRRRGRRPGRSGRGRFRARRRRDRGRRRR